MRHSSAPDVIAQQLQEFAEDLAKNKFSDWGIQIQPQGGGALKLLGDNAGTHFVADVRANESVVTLSLTGQVSLSRIKMTLAGGPEGVRRRVQEGISQVLQKHLSGS